LLIGNVLFILIIKRTVLGGRYIILLVVIFTVVQALFRDRQGMRQNCQGEAEAVKAGNEARPRKGRWRLRPEK